MTIGDVKIEYTLFYSLKLDPIKTDWKVTRNVVIKSRYFNAIDDLQEVLNDFGMNIFLCTVL